MVHGKQEKEVWLVSTKAESGKKCITYQESLEEALCFGWVDSIIQKIDEEKYARKFTPRRRGSQWSELNKHLAAKLIKEGRMTEAGMAKVEFKLEEAAAIRPKRALIQAPEWLKEGLKQSPEAWEFFESLAPSRQRNYILWISDAKREETRQKRIREAIERLERKEILGI